MTDRNFQPDKGLPRNQIDRLRTMEHRLRAFGLTSPERQKILNEVQDLYRDFKATEKVKK